MEKIIHKLINEFTQGVDIYNHNGSTWLIFTESKQWVVELTESKTLWYNYTFFQEVFRYTSLEVVENQQHITKWVEDNTINKVNYTEIGWHQCNNIDDTIERGVKDTLVDISEMNNYFVDDALKNGVKETITSENRSRLTAENIIENGVKETQFHSNENKIWIEGVIKDGVKEIKPDNFNVGGFLCEDVIKNGVKETYECDWDVPTDLIEDVITDGVKETKVCNYTDPKTQLMYIKWGNDIEDIIENGEKISGTYVGGNRQKENIESVIGYGIKETKTPGEDGDIVGITNWMMENNTKNVPKMIDDIIENGVKEVKSWNDSIIGDLNQNGLIDNVINEGIKETKGDASQNPMGKVTKVIKEGIKTPTY